MVLRLSGQMLVYMFVNAPDEHIRFRYLHMFPKQLDQEGVLSGRILKEGEEFGKVGSFFQHERATTYHLHFDMQLPTKYGWVFVNPYMTLVAAYERLIGGRGQEVKDPPSDEFRAEIKPAAARPGGLPALSSARASDAANPVQSGVQSGANERVAAEKTQD